MKQAIVVRADLKLSAGKAIAQACHASLEAYKKAGLLAKRKWEMQGQKKVVLAVSNEKELREIYAIAKNEKLPSAIIKDAGLTEIPAGTVTALGIGPAEDTKVDKVTGRLKLY